MSRGSWADLRKAQRAVRRRKLKRRFLGYGQFYGVYWGSCVRFWQFQGSIFPTAAEAAAQRVSHCLSNDTRRVYNTTVLNTGHHTSPHWERATRKFLR